MSEGVAARILFASICALLGGAWLLRRLRSPEPRAEEPSRLVPLLRATLVALSAIWLLVWIVIAAVRFRYPYELEWNSGAMRDQCVRLLTGQPLFSPPTVAWIPYFYTPLYIQICAALMRLSGGHVSFEAMRAVSIAAALGSATLIYVWTRLLIQPRLPTVPAEERAPAARRVTFWSVAAVGIFFAAYRMTGAWYDIERVDSLLLFFTLLGGLCLDRALDRRGGTALPSAAAAGVALSLALLTKQQSLVYLLGGALCLASRRAWQLLAVYGGAAAVVSIGGIWLDSLNTGGWFWRYCFEIPVAQGFQRELAVQFFTKDMLLFAPSLVVVAVAVAAAVRVRPMGGKGSTGAVDGVDGVENRAGPRVGAVEDRGGVGGAAFVFVAAGALFVSFTSRAHWGGYENVLIPAFTFTAMAACVVAARLEAAHRRASLPLLLLALAQLLTLTYRPDKQVPTAESFAAGARYLAAVRDAETRGHVLSYDHGGFTRTPHLHSLSVANFTLAHRPIPEDVRADFLAGYYDTIFVDMPPVPGSDVMPLLANYRLAGCLGISRSWVVTGYATPNPDRQVWLLKPVRAR